MENQALLEKWDIILEAENAPTVSNKPAMSQILENQEQFIISEASTQGDMAAYTPILVPAVRRFFPNLLANEIVGVQPMSMPTGYAYALRYAYDKNALNTATDRGAVNRVGYADNKLQNFVIITSTPITASITAGTTALGTLTNTTVMYAEGTSSDAVTVTGSAVTGKEFYKLLVSTTNASELLLLKAGLSTVTVGSSTATVVATLPAEAGYNAILKYFSGPVSTAVGETMGATNGAEFKSMRMGIERVSIEAQTRKLKAEYTHEMAQDLKAVHGLDAEAELINILEYEITAELDRELVDAINSAATITQNWTYGYTGIGATSASGTSTADGRWEVEKFRTLYTRIIRESNQIALTSRRGQGNFIIASSNVISALEVLSNFMYSAVPGDVKPTLGVAKVGTLDGRFSVYLDTFAFTDYVTVGYKGAGAFDTGIIYCPYVPLILQKVQDPNTFQPKVAMFTRDAICANLFGASNYYRRFAVNLAGSSLIGGNYNFWNN